jgi:NAD+ kinase
MNAAEIGASCDAAIVMGGDGTMLGIARQLAPFNVPLIGINQGRLGFMTDIPLEGMHDALARILSGSYKAERRTLLEGRVMRGGDTIHVGMAVNDVVVARHRRRHGRTARRRRRPVHVQPALRWPDHLDPTGSTAYALSAGGLLHPALGGIAGADCAARAVQPPHRAAGIERDRGGDRARRDISVNFDMQTFASLQSQDRIVIQRSPHAITFLHPDGWSYHTLREKLHWNEYPSGEGKLA